MQRRLSLLAKVFLGLENGFAFIGFILSFILMILVSVNIILRYFFSSPITGTIELTELLMVPMVFFPLAFAQKSGGHIRADALYNLIPYPYKGALDVLINTLGCAVCALFAWLTFQDGWAAYLVKDITPGHVKILTWPFRVAIPIGFFVLAVRFIYEMIHAFKPSAKPVANAGQAGEEHTC
ncbi:MAG: TRAP transporter small permease [Deltaproteobacteria bacterium]|nr:TRAP transporter small permease [Deltaproteobacteria bacterium]